MVDPVLFDLKCVSLGFPPLYDSTHSAAGMIFDLPSEQRRKISRKIRKIVRKEITQQCLEIQDSRKRTRRRDLLESYTNLSSEKSTFCKEILVKRLSLVKNHVTRIAKQEASENAG